LTERSKGFLMLASWQGQSGWWILLSFPSLPQLKSYALLFMLYQMQDKFYHGPAYKVVSNNVNCCTPETPVKMK
jgi:hypothetical protein